MRHKTAISAFLLLALCAAIGCENADSEKGVSWNGASRPATTTTTTTAATSAATTATTATATTTTTAAKPATTTTTTTSATSATTTTTAAGNNIATRSLPTGTPATTGGVADAVPFSSLSWSFGGVSGSGAKQSGVVISGLSCSKNGLSFRYNKDLSAWGRSKSSAGDIACLFVQRSNGSWVGGKFDWISSSRTTRDFKNIYENYHGWSLAGVPNPCNVAFVILSGDCKRRSNVISGRWAR